MKSDFIKTKKHSGINLFDKPMPDIELETIHLWQQPNSIRWVETTQDRENNSVITLFTGEEGERVAYGMNGAIAEYAKSGCNVIVDCIAYKKEWLDDLTNNLNGLPVYWVKVSIPLAMLEEREAIRATSPKGHARSHYATVFWDKVYDLEVNSDQYTAAQIAQQIKDVFRL